MVVECLDEWDCCGVLLECCLVGCDYVVCVVYWVVWEC